MADASDTHVVPINDLREHADARSCWCRPLLEEHPGGILVIHHALDGREYSEPDFDPALAETVQ